MEPSYVSLRRTGMTSKLNGPLPAPRTLRAGLAAAVLVPLLVACGSASAGSSGSGSGSGGGNGVEKPAGTPSAAAGLCGLSPEGAAERKDGAMTYPATTDYVGKSEADARALAESRGLKLRVVGKDGDCGVITDDLQTTRINVYLEGGTVTGVGAF
jgi:hypothetical protein